MYIKVDECHFVSKYKNKQLFLVSLLYCSICLSPISMLLTLSLPPILLPILYIERKIIKNYNPPYIVSISVVTHDQWQPSSVVPKLFISPKLIEMTHFLIFCQSEPTL